MSEATTRVITDEVELEAAVRLAAPSRRAKDESEETIRERKKDLNNDRHITVGTFSTDGRLLATAGLRKNIGMPGSGIGRLINVTTSEYHRNQGHGRAVVSFVESIAAREGVGTLKVVSLKDSVEFYQALGYKSEANRPPASQFMFKTLQ